MRDSTNVKTENIIDSISLKSELHKQGYFFYKINSITKDSLTTYSIYPGKKINTITIQQKNQRDLSLTPYEFNNWTKTLNNQLDEIGESFTNFSLNQQQIKNDTLFCSLQKHQTSKRVIDKIVTKGYSKFSKRFLKHYIKTTKVFNQQALKTIEAKINNLKFVKNIKAPGVLFTKDSTHIYLYLDKVKANKLDALLGFTNTENNSLQFNGYIDIELLNTLHKGEYLAFKWKNSGNDQQQTDLTLQNPYIFNSPINTEYHLNITKQDSTFVNTSHRFELNIKPNYKHQIGGYYYTQNSSTFNNFTDNESYTKNIFGINYIYLKNDNWKLPKTKIEIDFGYGNKKSTNTESQQALKSDFIHNFEFSKQHHLFIRNRSAFLQSENKTENELYRTGGATTMRGFLEQSITSYLHNYTNFEYRIHTNTSSYLYTFSDIGFFRNTQNSNNLLSLGLGYTLGQKNGLLKLSYAVGRNERESFNINKGFFHINFINLF